MPTFIGNINNDQIILVSGVSTPERKGVEPRSYPALLDTGAQRTLISEKVVRDLGLAASGKSTIIPVSGKPLLMDFYRVVVSIPITSGFQMPDGNLGMSTFSQGKEMDVVQLPYQPQDHQILLGMDILSLFHLTIHGKGFILSN